MHIPGAGCQHALRRAADERGLAAARAAVAQAAPRLFQRRGGLALARPRLVRLWPRRPRRRRLGGRRQGAHARHVGRAPRPPPPRRRARRRRRGAPHAEQAPRWRPRAAGRLAAPVPLAGRAIAAAVPLASGWHPRVAGHAFCRRPAAGRARHSRVRGQRAHHRDAAGTGRGGGRRGYALGVRAVAIRDAVEHASGAPARPLAPRVRSPERWE